MTLSEHCGYEFIDTGAFHNIHHKTFTTNFGVSGVFDNLHNTRSFRHEVENVDGDALLERQEAAENK